MCIRDSPTRPTPRRAFRAGGKSGFLVPHLRPLGTVPDEPRVVFEFLEGPLGMGAGSELGSTIAKSRVFSVPAYQSHGHVCTGTGHWQAQSLAQSEVEACGTTCAQRAREKRARVDGSVDAAPTGPGRGS